MVLALLMVTDGKSGAAAVAQLKRFDRIPRVLRQFLIEYRHRTVYIVCHAILHWVEDFLASLGSQGIAHPGATPGPEPAEESSLAGK